MRAWSNRTILYALATISEHDSVEKAVACLRDTGGTVVTLLPPEKEWRPNVKAPDHLSFIGTASIMNRRCRTQLLGTFPLFGSIRHCIHSRNTSDGRGYGQPHGFVGWVSPWVSSDYAPGNLVTLL